MQVKFWARIALVVSILGGAQTAFSLTPRTGEYTCSRLGDKKYECLRAIRDRFVDQWASGACDRYTNIDHTIDCMWIIAGHRYQSNAVVACDRFNSSVDTNSCLRTIADCTFSDAQVRECDRLSTTSATLDCFNYYCGQK